MEVSKLYDEACELYSTEAEIEAYVAGAKAQLEKLAEAEMSQRGIIIVGGAESMKKTVLALGMAFGVTGAFATASKKEKDPGDWDVLGRIRELDLTLHPQIDREPSRTHSKPKWFQGSESTKFKAKNANNNYSTRKFKRNNRHK